MGCAVLDSREVWTRYGSLMSEKPDCKRCQRIEAAIEQGLSRDAAREQYRWDECARDHCPMVPRTYNGGGDGYGYGA